MVMNRMRALSLAVMMAAGFITTTAAMAAEPAKLAIKLTPLPEQQGAAAIGTITVNMQFDGLHIGSNEPVFMIALVADNVDTVATTLTGLTASDAKGPLKLTYRDVDRHVEAARDSETGGPTREWFTDRPIEGTINVKYTVPAKATLPPRGPTGPIGFRNDADGFSGAGNIFLLMPLNDQEYAVTTSWDFSHMPSGDVGVSSLGVGTATSSVPMTSAQVRESYFMGGQVNLGPRPQAGQGFFSVWQGKPPFDAAELMGWTSNLYSHYLQFFGQKASRPYGVFLRYNPVNAGGGTGFFHSFVATYGPAPLGSGAEVLKTTLAHEMFHTFSPYITNPPGKESSWFGEGLAVFYEARLPLRFGLLSPEEFLEDLNFGAGRYYSSVMLNQPNSVVAAHFWDDTRIRTLAYDRGMLYFVTVDDAVRKESHGKRSLDDLMLKMVALGDQGKVLTNGDWEGVLRDELGEGAVADFRAFLGGKEPIAAPDAFGPCFTRIEVPLRRYEVGFEPAVLGEPKRIVRNLVPGSAAEKAGLRNGDVIVDPVPQDEIQGNQTELLKLKIKRGDREFTISYLPRGETVGTYQWKRIPGVPDNECKL